MQTYAGLKLKRTDERFINHRNHVKLLSDHFSNLEKIGGHMRKHTQGLADDLDIKYPIFSLLANSESDMGEIFSRASAAFNQLADVSQFYVRQMCLVARVARVSFASPCVSLKRLMSNSPIRFTSGTFSLMQLLCVCCSYSDCLACLCAHMLAGAAQAP
jgi:hypothetical protein